MNAPVRTAALYGPYVRVYFWHPYVRAVRTGVKKCTRTYIMHPYVHPSVRVVRTALKAQCHVILFTNSWSFLSMCFTLSLEPAPSHSVNLIQVYPTLTLLFLRLSRHLAASILHSHHQQLPHSFTPGSEPTFLINPFQFPPRTFFLPLPGLTIQGFFTCSVSSEP